MSCFFLPTFRLLFKVQAEQSDWPKEKAREFRGNLKNYFIYILNILEICTFVSIFYWV